MQRLYRSDLLELCRLVVLFYVFSGRKGEIVGEGEHV